jgi:hypothetical protein
MANGDTSDPKDLDRGIKDLDRAIKDLDRAIKDLDRGDGGGASGSTVEDLFRRVSGLGGLLVVAFVAPVAPASNGDNRSRGPRGLAIASAANLAEARDQEAALQQRVKTAKRKAREKSQALQEAAKK